MAVGEHRDRVGLGGGVGDGDPGRAAVGGFFPLVGRDGVAGGGGGEREAVADKSGERGGLRDEGRRLADRLELDKENAVAGQGVPRVVGAAGVAGGGALIGGASADAVGGGARQLEEAVGRRRREIETVNGVGRERDGGVEGELEPDARAVGGVGGGGRQLVRFGAGDGVGLVVQNETGGAGLRRTRHANAEDRAVRHAIPGGVGVAGVAGVSKPDGGDEVAVGIGPGGEGLALVSTIRRHVGEGVVLVAVGTGDTVVAYVGAISGGAGEIIDVGGPRSGGGGAEGQRGGGGGLGGEAEAGEGEGGGEGAGGMGGMTNDQ